MIQEAKKLRFELDILKEKMGATNDPVFNGINEKTVITLDGEDEGSSKEEPPKDEGSNKVIPSINVDINVDDEKSATGKIATASEIA